MSAITACMLTSLSLTLAPIPAEPPPDPMARGYVGITVTTGGLSIERVEPGMPGDKSGLRSGDVIARVGTLEPQTFDQVVSHICSFRPGAIVEVEVQRGTERKTFKVKLASRPASLDQNGPVSPNGPIIIED